MARYRPVAEGNALRVPTNAVNDVKAVLQRYGISRFTYHMWGPLSARSRAGVEASRGEKESLVKTSPRAFFDPGLSRSELSSSAGRGGDPPDPGREGAASPPPFSAAVQGEPLTLDTSVQPVAWDEPEDLREARLPIFRNMVVSPELVQRLAQRRRYSVEACRGGETALSDLGEMEQVAGAGRFALLGRAERVSPTGHASGYGDSEVAGGAAAPRVGDVRGASSEGGLGSQGSSGRSRERQAERREPQIPSSSESAAPLQFRRDVSARTQLQRLLLQGVRDE